MEFIELFSDALTYPTKDWKKLLILGVLFLIMGIFQVLAQLGVVLVHNIGAMITLAIGGLLTVILTIFIKGYGLSITRDTIGLQEAIPDFDWVKNFIDGIKLIVLEIVYYIIPVVLILVIAYVSGAFSHVMKIINYVATSGSTNIPQSLVIEAATSFLLVFLIGMILIIIFGLLYLIATAKLAETGSLVESCDMIEVFNKIGEIGWVNFIIWIVGYIIISIIIAIVGRIIGIIPIFGLIIALLVISPFTQMFVSRALGLLYNEAKNN